MTPRPIVVEGNRAVTHRIMFIIGTMGTVATGFIDWAGRCTPR